MSLSLLIFVVAMCFVVYYGYKALRKAWKRADMDDALDDVKLTSEEAKRAQVVDLGEHKKNKKEVNKVLDLKGK